MVAHTEEGESEPCVARSPHDTNPAQGDIMTSGSSSVAMRELADGIVFWCRHPNWPADFDHMEYQVWAEQNPNGAFTLAWWHQYQLPRLRRWIATRPISGGILTARFAERIADLSSAWRQVCQPHINDDISNVSWEDVEAFPIKMAELKPMKVGTSVVFTSKFCHFLLPRVFPVVDNEGLGNRWPDYKTFFTFVQAEWRSTEPAIRNDLAAELTRLIEKSGNSVSAGFPMANKIVELRLMGRRYPATK